MLTVRRGEGNQPIGTFSNATCPHIFAFTVHYSAVRGSRNGRPRDGRGFDVPHVHSRCFPLRYVHLHLPRPSRPRSTMPRLRTPSTAPLLFHARVY